MEYTEARKTQAENIERTEIIERLHQWIAEQRDAGSAIEDIRSAALAMNKKQAWLIGQDGRKLRLPQRRLVQVLEQMLGEKETPVLEAKPRFRWQQTPGGHYVVFGGADEYLVEQKNANWLIDAFPFGTFKDARSPSVAPPEKAILALQQYLADIDHAETSSILGLSLPHYITK